ALTTAISTLSLHDALPISCFVPVGDQLVMSSTVELGKDLIDELKRGSKSQPQPATMRTQLYASGAARALRDTEEQVMTQLILTQALPPAAAREEVRKIIALVERLGTLGFEINYGKSDFTFDVRWQMTPRSGTEKETNIDDAYEAVFRHQFKNNFSALKEKAKRYCLSINGENASAEFLRRFEGHQPPVRPKSEFERKEALIFQVTDLK